MQLKEGDRAGVLLNACTADRFPYAGMTRFRFSGYDLSPARKIETGHPQPCWFGLCVNDTVVWNEPQDGVWFWYEI